MHEQVTLARALAWALHRDQVDKADRPYLEHLEAVASGARQIAVDAGLGAERVAYVEAAGWLHDSVEDQRVSPGELLAVGVAAEVVVIVELLTHPKGMPRRDYLLRIAAVLDAKIVKVADARHNGDPERLALIDEAAERDRLDGKYQETLEILGPVPDPPAPYSWVIDHDVDAAIGVPVFGPGMPAQDARDALGPDGDGWPFLLMDPAGRIRFTGRLLVDVEDLSNATEAATFGPLWDFSRRDENFLANIEYRVHGGWLRPQRTWDPDAPVTWLWAPRTDGHTDVDAMLAFTDDSGAEELLEEASDPSVVDGPASLVSAAPAGDALV